MTQPKNPEKEYPQRVEKSENMYASWEAGDGDTDELAIGLYNLTAEYKALYDDYVNIEAMLQQAAKDAFDSDVVQTQMLTLELEANPWIGEEQYKADWIESWLSALRENIP